jgi:cobalt-precorrin 5A hydrolase
MPMAKEVSASVLSGERIGFFSDIPVVNKLPEYFSENEKNRVNIKVGIGPVPSDTLLLVPEGLCLGIGCKRGTACSDIECAVSDFLDSIGVPIECISNAASIDLKKDEAGLLEFFEKHGINAAFYGADELNSIEGNFTKSDFVRQKTGVDCVCERAAVLNTGGKLMVGKTRFSGITLALARREMRIMI